MRNVLKYATILFLITSGLFANTDLIIKDVNDHVFYSNKNISVESVTSPTNEILVLKPINMDSNNVENVDRILFIDKILIGRDINAFGGSSNSIVIGNGAATNVLGTNAVIIGYLAGQDTGNASYSRRVVYIGDQAGFDPGSSSYTVAIGYRSGGDSDGQRSVFIGREAGTYNQDKGNVNKTTNQWQQVGIGYKALHNFGLYSSGNDNIGIGTRAGHSADSRFSIMMGYNAAYSNKGNTAIIMGNAAGLFNNSDMATIIGRNAGMVSEGYAPIILGMYAGAFSTNTTEVIYIGHDAGLNYNGPYSIILGKNAGRDGAGENNVLIGQEAGRYISNQYVNAIGYKANHVGGRNNVTVFSGEDGKQYFMTGLDNNGTDGFFGVMLDNITYITNEVVVTNKRVSSYTSLSEDGDVTDTHYYTYDRVLTNDVLVAQTNTLFRFFKDSNRDGILETAIGELNEYDSLTFSNMLDNAILNVAEINAVSSSIDNLVVSNLDVTGSFELTNVTHIYFAPTGHIVGSVLSYSDNMTMLMNSSRMYDIGLATFNNEEYTPGSTNYPTTTGTTEWVNNWSKHPLTEENISTTTPNAYIFVDVGTNVWPANYTNDWWIETYIANDDVEDPAYVNTNYNYTLAFLTNAGVSNGWYIFESFPLSAKAYILGNDRFEIQYTNIWTPSSSTNYGRVYFTNEVLEEEFVLNTNNGTIVGNVCTTNMLTVYTFVTNSYSAGDFIFDVLFDFSMTNINGLIDERMSPLIQFGYVDQPTTDAVFNACDAASWTVDEFYPGTTNVSIVSTCTLASTWYPAISISTTSDIPLYIETTNFTYTGTDFVKTGGAGTFTPPGRWSVIVSTIGTWPQYAHLSWSNLIPAGTYTFTNVFKYNNTTDQGALDIYSTNYIQYAWGADRVSNFAGASFDLTNGATEFITSTNTGTFTATNDFYFGFSFGSGYVTGFPTTIVCTNVYVTLSSSTGPVYICTPYQLDINQFNISEVVVSNEFTITNDMQISDGVISNVDQIIFTDGSKIFWSNSLHVSAQDVLSLNSSSNISTDADYINIKGDVEANIGVEDANITIIDDTITLDSYNIDIDVVGAADIDIGGAADIDVEGSYNLNAVNEILLYSEIAYFNAGGGTYELTIEEDDISLQGDTSITGGDLDVATITNVETIAFDAGQIIATGNQFRIEAPNGSPYPNFVVKLGPTTYIEAKTQSDDITLGANSTQLILDDGAGEATLTANDRFIVDTAGSTDELTVESGTVTIRDNLDVPVITNVSSISFTNGTTLPADAGKWDHQATNAIYMNTNPIYNVERLVFSESSGSSLRIGELAQGIWEIVPNNSVLFPRMLFYTNGPFELYSPNIKLGYDVGAGVISGIGSDDVISNYFAAYFNKLHITSITGNAPIQVDQNFNLSGNTISNGSFKGDGSGLTNLSSVAGWDQHATNTLYMDTNAIVGISYLENTNGIKYIAPIVNDEEDSLVIFGGSTSGSNVFGVGKDAVESNSGDYVNALGYRAAYINEGDYVNAIGPYAAYRAPSVADYIDAMGYRAAYSINAPYNIAIGYEAAYDNSGRYSVGIGYSALHTAGSSADYTIAAGYYAGATIDASYSVAIGPFSATNSSGANINAIGNRAAANNANVQYINAIGVESAFKNSEDYVNAFGYQAAYENSGDYVDALGYQAGYRNVGGNSTMLGLQAGYSNRVNYLTAIGDRAGFRNAGSPVTAVGKEAAFFNLGDTVNAFGFRAAYSNALSGISVDAFGEDAARENSGGGVIAIGSQAARENAGSIVTAIGVSSAYRNSGLSVIAIGTYACRTNSGANITAIGTSAAEGSGGQWITAVGVSAARENSGQYITAIGQQAGQYNEEDWVVAIGYSSAYKNSGSNITAIGQAALQENTGHHNEAIGSSALAYNEGDYCFAGGYQAGYTNSGDYVNAIGYQAAYGNTGTNIVAIGKNAVYGNTGYLNKNVVGIGNESAYNNLAYGIVAIGYQSAYSNQLLGNRIVSIGYKAGYQNSGGYSVFIGPECGYNNSGHYVAAMGWQAAYGNANNHVNAIGRISAYGNKGYYVNCIGYKAGSGNTNNYCNFIGTFGNSCPSTAAEQTWVAGDLYLTDPGSGETTGNRLTFQNNISLVTTNSELAVNTNIVAMGVRVPYDMQGGTASTTNFSTTVEFDYTFSGTPAVTCTFSDDPGELSLIIVSNITSSSFNFSVRTGAGISDELFDINYTAIYTP
jgi:hypothetical protein